MPLSFQSFRGSCWHPSTTRLHCLRGAPIDDGFGRAAPRTRRSPCDPRPAVAGGVVMGVGWLAATEEAGSLGATQPTDRGRGPVGSRASPLRGLGRCNGCRAAAVIHPLVHRGCDLRLAGFLLSTPPVPPIRAFPIRPLALATAQMSRGPKTPPPPLPRSPDPE